MDPIEARAHESQSFVIHLWLEDSVRAGKPSPWRGSVAHVQTREPCSVDSLTDIALILATRLMAAGFLLRWYERIWVRLMKATLR